jgi:hypothetical protein
MKVKQGKANKANEGKAKQARNGKASRKSLLAMLAEQTSSSSLVLTE